MSTVSVRYLANDVPVAVHLLSQPKLEQAWGRGSSRA